MVAWFSENWHCERGNVDIASHQGLALAKVFTKALRFARLHSLGFSEHKAPRWKLRLPGVVCNLEK